MRVSVLCSLALLAAATPLAEQEEDHTAPRWCWALVQMSSDMPGAGVVESFCDTLEQALTGWARQTPLLCQRIVVVDGTYHSKYGYTARVSILPYEGVSNGKPRDVGVVRFTSSDAKLQGCYTAQCVAAHLLVMEGLGFHLAQPEITYKALEIERLEYAFARIQQEIPCSSKDGR